MNRLAFLILALAATRWTGAACPVVEDPWLRLAVDIREGKMERLDCLIDADTLNAHDPKDGMQSTPLHLAAKYSRPRIVQYLIDKGANLEALDATDRTPLQISLDGGHADDAAAVLILNGANIEAPDGEGRTPLYWSIAWGRPAIAELLLNRRADRAKQVGILVGDEYQKISIEEYGRRSNNPAIRELFATTREQQ